MEQSRWATTAPNPPVSVPDTRPESTPQPPAESPQHAPEFVIQPDNVAESMHSIPSFDGTMDDFEEFAQTRPPDDLFSDDFEPIAEPVVEEPIIPVQKIPSGPKHPRKGQRQHGTPKQTPVLPPTDKDGNPIEGPRKDSVRGDRSGTGGVKMTKLTEEELSKRMEAVRLKNQALEAAHARAEADEASYQAREAEAAEKRKLERQNRQQMMGEREKNRLRKMNAQGGREWDVQKEDEPQGRQQRRPAEEDDQDLSQYIYEDYARGGHRGRGRGGRGRGRGKGGFDGGQQTSSARALHQAVPTTNDFPSLPVTSPPAQVAAPQKIELAIGKSSLKASGDGEATTATNGRSWADEMETPVESQNKT